MKQLRYEDDPQRFDALMLALGDAHVVNDLLTGRLCQILLFTLAVEIINALHVCGYILSGKLVHRAMNDLLIIATRDVNLHLWRGLLNTNPRSGIQSCIALYCAAPACKVIRGNADWYKPLYNHLNR